MIKNILFDCGGVFTEMHLRDRMLALSGSEALTDEFMRIAWAENGPWQRYDKGEVSSKEIAAELKRAYPDASPYIDAFVTGWVDALPGRGGMDALLDLLKAKGYPCYMLSNFPDCFDEMYERVPALKRLDGVVVSSRIKMLKPDPAIFKKAAEILSIEPSETLFVDDLPVNVEGAEKAGMIGYLFDGEEEFAAYLKSKGVI